MIMVSEDPQEIVLGYLDQGLIHTSYQMFGVPPPPPGRMDPQSTEHS